MEKASEEVRPVAPSECTAAHVISSLKRSQVELGGVAGVRCISLMHRTYASHLCSGLPHRVYATPPNSTWLRTR